MAGPASEAPPPSFWQLRPQNKPQLLILWSTAETGKQFSLDFSSSVHHRLTYNTLPPPLADPPAPKNVTSNRASGPLLESDFFPSVAPLLLKDNTFKAVVLLAV